MARGKNWNCQLDIISRDSTNLEIDVFHSMACYLITQGAGHKSSDEDKCLFQCFVNIWNGGASDKVHKGMKSCFVHVPAVASELKSSAIRVSAADQMAQQPILNIYGAIVRGGLFLEGE